MVNWSSLFATRTRTGVGAGLIDILKLAGEGARRLGGLLPEALDRTA
jgi:hypothetical protein